MGTFFVPQLGQAPKWCSFLENLTEEMEETKQTQLYEDYKFVSKADLDKIGGNHLIGSNVLKAYMHGYFMQMKLY